MALRLIEGYDHLGSSAKFQTKGWTFVSASRTGESSTLTFVTGRINGKAARHSTSGTGVGSYTVNGTCRKSITAAATYVVGFALNLNTLPPSETEVFQLLAAGTAAVRIFITSTGAVRVKNSGSTTLATGAAGLVVGGNWVFIEFKAFANGASGTIETHVNGATDVASTTANVGSTNFDQIGHFFAPVSGSYIPTIDFDDTYAIDTTGSDNTTFTGDAHVETIVGSADGSNSQWTPDTGTAHFSRTNEMSGTYPDDDTSYVYDNTAGHYDTYAFGDLAALSGTVFGVQTNLYARKDDAATRQIKSVVRSGGSNHDGSSTATLSLSYATYSEIFENDPQDAGDWTVSRVNSAEYGVKLVA